MEHLGQPGLRGIAKKQQAGDISVENGLRFDDCLDSRVHRDSKDTMGSLQRIRQIGCGDERKTGVGGAQPTEKGSLSRSR